MVNKRYGWLALADTVKQVALVEDEAPPEPADRGPKKVRLGALALKKATGDVDERPRATSERSRHACTRGTRARRGRRRRR